MANLRFLKQIEKLAPGEYAKRFAQETAAKKAFKSGEMTRSVSPPKVPSVDKKFAQYYLEQLEQEAKKNPTSENIKRLEEARKDLVGEIESAPRSLEEQAAMSRLEKIIGPEKEQSSLNDFTKKAATIAALTGGGLAASSLMPEEAEASVKGSATARKKLLETTEKIMDAWTSGKKGASGGRELRETLQNQLDLDPTGTAKKEALRRLAARTEVRTNPVTGEHEFKVYRGGVKDRFSESPQSFTTNPDVAQEFADAYGGSVKEVWLPASKVGSIPSIMKEGQYLSSEGEVIAKPFKAESTPYTSKKESLHERISKRGKQKEEDDLLHEGWPEDLIEQDLPSSFKKTAGIAAATGIGAGGLAASSAQASEGPTVSQSNPEHTSSTTSKTVKDAVSEAEQKSKGLSALEAYGTAARSGVSSATLGISEPVISGISALVGNLIESGFDSKDALDFAKKAISLERLKKEYRADLDYRKKMKEEHPIADIGGSLVGAFAPVGPAAKVFGAVQKGVETAIPAIKAAQEAKGLKAAATRVGGGILEGAAGMPIVSGIENIAKKTIGDEEEFSPAEDAFMGGAFGGGMHGALEIGKAVGGKKIAGGLGALALAAGLSGDKAQTKGELDDFDLTEDQKNELRWQSMMRRINKKSSER